MKLPRPPKGFTLVELLVVITIIAVLAGFAVPAVTSAITKGQLIQAVNNARQIHIATMSMANDGAANSDATLGWPGDTGVTDLNTFVAFLCGYDYLKPSDLKVFSAAGVTAYTSGTVSTSGSTPTLSPAFSYTTNSAFNVYKVADNDAGNTVFISTKNYDRTASALSDTTKPFGEKGFVVCRKGGDVSMYKKQQVSNTNMIGSVTTGSTTGYLQ
ncbi:MAG: type II secretion system protein [Chthoniobacteraceae bacterium]